MEKPWDDLARAGEWLLDLERRLKPDVVHLNSFTTAVPAFEAPKVVVGHSCVLSWWQAVRGQPAPADWKWYQFQVTRALRAADLVIAPSRAMLRALESHYGPLGPAETIPNGRDPALFVPLPKENFVLTAGRLWDDAKNLAALVRVAPRLSWPIFAAGDAPAFSSQNPLPPQVRVLGRLGAQSMASWFGRAPIYALPARYEPFGLSVLEAALAGCALVLGDIPSLRENWENAAIFVPPNDTDALGRSLDELIGDPGVLALFAERARLRALEFTPVRMATGYLSAYSELMMTKVPQGKGVLQTVA